MQSRFLPLCTAILVLPMLSITSLAADSPAAAEIVTAPLAYEINGAPFEGSISRPAHLAAPAPGVLVVHDWTGYGPFAKARAEDLARLGYTALAVDMYGKGIHAANPGEAQKLSAPFYQDFQLFRTRAQAALGELLKQPNVDPKRLGAIGFCFGGTTVLELARSGAPLTGLVTFHGGLKTALPAQAGTPQVKEMLILHGALDPLVPPVDVANFMTEMNAAHLTYRLVAYPNAVHAFTNPEAGHDPTKPTAYNQPAAEAAFGEMRAFFARIFAP